VSLISKGLLPQQMEGETEGEPADLGSPAKQPLTLNSAGGGYQYTCSHFFYHSLPSLIIFMFIHSKTVKINDTNKQQNIFFSFLLSCA